MYVDLPMNLFENSVQLDQPSTQFRQIFIRSYDSKEKSQTLLIACPQISLPTVLSQQTVNFKDSGLS